MTKFENLGRTLAALVCTIVLSTTLVVGAVGPATAAGQGAPIARILA